LPAPSEIRRFDGTSIPRTILSGPGCRRQVADEAARLGIERVVLVASPTLSRTTQFVAEVREMLGPRCAGVLHDVVPHATSEAVAITVERARVLSPDAVLSIGGGAAHDTAKAIALSIPSGRGIGEFASRFIPPDTFVAPAVNVVPLPVLTMPSTFSAAEVVGGGAVTDARSGEKLIFVHPLLTPACVFVDGEVVASTPRAILAPSAMNALHHCVEALYSRGRQPVTDVFASGALRTLIHVLPALAPQAADPSLSTIQLLADAAAISGLTYANSWLGVGHSVCHSIGGRYRLSHGAANAVMVRHSMRFNLDAAVEPLALAARAAGITEADQRRAAQAFITLVDDIAARLKMPASLREIGVPQDAFGRIADDVLADPQTYWNPRPVTRDDVLALLHEAW
jgi:alcohol dehydrogenase class IV